MLILDSALLSFYFSSNCPHGICHWHAWNGINAKSCGADHWKIFSFLKLQSWLFVLLPYHIQTKILTISFLYCCVFNYVEMSISPVSVILCIFNVLLAFIFVVLWSNLNFFCILSIHSPAPTCHVRVYVQMVVEWFSLYHPC